MKKLILLLFLSNFYLVNAQIFDVDNSFNPSDTGEFVQNIGFTGDFLNDGKIISVKKTFNNEKKIVRINPNGSIDNSFTQTSFYYPEAIEINVFTNKIDGDFYIARKNLNNTILEHYNPDGTIDTNFNICLITSSSGLKDVYALKIMNDGNLIVAGNFNNVNSLNYSNICKISNLGIVDTNFNIGTGFNNIIRAIDIQSDNKIIAVGEFDTYNGNNYNNSIRGIARLNYNGSLDTSFGVYYSISSFGGTQNGYNHSSGQFYDVKIQNDGKIVTSGVNIRRNGSNYSQGLVRLNSNGSIDLSFTSTASGSKKFIIDNYGWFYYQSGNRLRLANNIGFTQYTSSFIDLNTSPNNTYYFILLNNKIIVNGNYINSDGITRNGFFRLNMNGSIDLTFNPHFGPNMMNNDKLKIFKLPDNKLLMYGGFTTYNDIPVKKLFRLNENGTIDNTFNLDSTLTNLIFSSNTENPLEFNRYNYDGSIYLSLINPYGSTYIIKLDNNGSIDNTFNSIYKHPLQMIVTNDNELILVGANSNSFFTNNGYNILKKFDANGLVDNNFMTQPGFIQIKHIEYLNNENIILTAYNSSYDDIITTVDSNTGNNLNEFYTTTNGNNGKIRTKKLNDKIYFSNEGGGLNSSISRLNNDGTFDYSFNQISINYPKYFNFFSSNNHIIVLDNDNLNNLNKILKVYDYDGNYLYNIDIPVKSGTDNSTLNFYNSFAIQNCESIIVSGDFENILNSNKSFISRIKNPNLSLTPAPTGDTIQSFSLGQTLNDLIVYGQNIQWYSNQNICSEITHNWYKNSLSNNSTNILLPNNTPLVDGTTYYASQTINGIESNHRLPVTVHQLLSNDSFDNKKVWIYPNPTKNFININTEKEISKVELFNLVGQKIKSFKDLNEIDISDLQNGTYLIKIIFYDNSIIDDKIIKF